MYSITSIGSNIEKEEELVGQIRQLDGSRLSELDKTKFNLVQMALVKGRKMGLSLRIIQTNDEAGIISVS